MCSGKKLGSKEIGKLRRAYLETRSVESVSKACRVSPTTVRKYRREGKWDEVIKEAQKQASEGMVNELAEKYANDIKIINLAVSLMVQDLMEKVDAVTGKLIGKIPWNAKSFGVLLELRQALLGEPIGQGPGVEFKFPDKLIVTIDNEPRNNKTKRAKDNPS